jgi:hypothetical protein
MVLAGAYTESAEADPGSRKSLKASASRPRLAVYIELKARRRA